ncbi:MAG: AAA family ATPase [Lachnospiraceae bacterium]
MPEELTINEQKKNMSVSGTVDSVIYSSEETGYTVCLLESEGECVTVVGTLPYLTEGDRITAYGSFVNHPVYGVQFKCEFFERVMPETKGDILRYLSSGAVKGIGPKTASRIVDKFGEDSFDVIENHPDWLAEINGISQRKLPSYRRASARWRSARRDHVLPQSLLRRDRNENIQEMGRDPSKDTRKPVPLQRISRIGFAAPMRSRSRDRHRQCPTKGRPPGFPTSSRHICRNGKHPDAGGDTDTSAALLDVPAEILAPVLDDDKRPRRRHGLNGERYISRRAPPKRKILRREAVQLYRLCPRIGDADIPILILRCENDCYEYADLQKEAIYAALSGGVCVITGGPGTGKTTVIRALISIFDGLGLKCALAAPTGRAAKRMSEATSYEAKTVHRLLEMEYTGDNENASFLRDEKNLLDENVFIIDDASMIAIFLFQSLLRSI